MKYMERLERLHGFYESLANEWYSVGSEPPAEYVMKLRCIGRKLNRMYKQLGLFKFVY